MAAAEALGRPHRVEGVVVRGYGRGVELGFPTANVAPPMYSAIPADGVYAAWFTVLGHGPVTGTVIPGERYQACLLYTSGIPARRTLSRPGKRQCLSGPTPT